MRRLRLTHAIIMALVAATGLTSRSGAAAQWPAFLATYAGDTLWATMVFLTIGFIFPGAKSWRIALGALVISVAVECSQLVDAPQLNAWRDTVAGKLILGRDFLWSDLVCYAVGISGGLWLEWLVYRGRRKN